MKKRKLLVIPVLVLIMSFLALLPAGADEQCPDPPQCPLPPTCDNPPGVGTPGFWKNHPDAWQRCYGGPVEELPFGCTCEPCQCTDCCFVPKDTLIEWMQAPVAGNKVYTMISALTAAKLNRLAGNKSWCINQTIMRAVWWMEEYGFEESACGVIKMCSANEPCWQDWEWIYEELDQYNNGELCAPARD